jgi:Ser/Thr protein kinase RdoA (MazF antagonist)
LTQKLCPKLTALRHGGNASRQQFLGPQKTSNPLNMSAPLPTADIALELTSSALGIQALTARRFPSGLRHYVFEVALSDGSSVVTRISTPENRHVAQAAVTYSNLLRPRGVPLPQLLATDISAPFPFAVFERFAGTDLGLIAPRLTKQNLDAIANNVAQAQRIVSDLPGNGRFGFTATRDGARHTTWSQVLIENVDRSRRWLHAAPPERRTWAEKIYHAIERLRSQLDNLPPIAFLDDTTTKNVIVTANGDFSGIVDVDELCFGDPRLPVALTLASLQASNGPESYVYSWLRHAGFIDDAIFRLYVAIYFLCFISELGHSFNGNGPVDGGSRYKKLERLLAAALVGVSTAASSHR